MCYCDKTTVEIFIEISFINYIEMRKKRSPRIPVVKVRIQSFRTLPRSPKTKNVTSSYSAASSHPVRVLPLQIP